MGTALAFFLFYEGSYLFFAYIFTKGLNLLLSTSKMSPNIKRTAMNLGWYLS